MSGEQILDRKGLVGEAKGSARSASLILLTLLAMSLFAAAAFRIRLASPNEDFRKGMVLGLFSRRDPEYFRKNLREIRNLGANSVSFMIPKVQKDVRSTGLYDLRFVTPSDGSLRLATQEAHRLGLSVLFMPIVYVEELAEGEWRGTIAPADWDAWFRDYEEMILHYARLAQVEQVEFFSVGSELCSTEGFRDRWRGVIGKIRREYQGVLTYSANWDHLEPVSFAGDLDLLGMNAYYEVGRGEGADIETLTRRWADIQEGIRSWREANGGKPLVITEIGYPSREGASRDPWNYLAEGEADLEEQRKCYEAFFRAWKDEKMLSGVYFYLWWGEGGPEDRSYTPRGKPAQSVLEKWYRRDTLTGRSWPEKVREQ